MQSKKTFLRPVIDLQATGNRIKELRKQCGFSVRDLQDIFCFEYPQAIYAWEQGKNAPSVDNLLVLSSLFNTEIGSIVQTRVVSIEIECSKKCSMSEKESSCDVCRRKSA